MRPPTPGRRRAFTLLEMLLAVVVLSMVGVLVSTMLAQANDLASDNAQRDATLEITRVVRLMNEQWSDRRSTVPMGPGGETYMALPGEIAFITARPILGKDWPLARVRYRIVMDPASVVEPERRYDLVYEEIPVFRAGPESLPEDPQAEPEPVDWEEARRHILLRRCTNLRMERFLPDQQAAEEALGRERGSERGTASRDEESERLAELLEDSVSEWVVFDRVASGRLPPAVRILGEYEGEPFGCVFVGAALR